MIKQKRSKTDAQTFTLSSLISFVIRKSHADVAVSLRADYGRVGMKPRLQFTRCIAHNLSGPGGKPR
jgi:hypothetical protein